MKQAVSLTLNFCCGLTASFLVGLAASHFEAVFVMVAIALILVGVSITPAGHEVWCRWFVSEDNAIGARILIIAALIIGAGLAIWHGGR